MEINSSTFVSDPQLVKLLREQASSISCGHDQILFNEGQTPAGLYILHNGLVTLSRGREFNIALHTTACSLLDLPSLICGERHVFTAIARSGATLSFVHRDSFHTLLRADPTLHARVLQILAAEVEFTRQAILQQYGWNAEYAA